MLYYFEGKKASLKKRLHHAQLHLGFLTPSQNLKKPNDQIPEKSPDGRIDLFNRTFLATAGGSV